MNMPDALSGSGGLEGIRWMLRGAPRRALRRELGTLLSAPNILGPCQLRRVRFKPGRKFIAWYDARVRRDGTPSVRPMAVTWGSHRDGDRSHARAQLTEMEGEAARRGLLAPFRTLAVDTAPLRMHVRISPLDVRFPQLVRACDPQHVRDMVASAYAAPDSAPDRGPASRYTVTAIRYYPGQRHVLRYDPLATPARRALFAKLYMGDDGMEVFRLARHIGAWLAEYGAGVTSVRPVAYVAEDAVILYPQVFGTPLSQRLRRPDASVASALRSAGAALHALHQLPQALAGPLELNDFAAEVKKVAPTREHVFALLPSAATALSAVLDRAREVHERLPVEPVAFLHGDFKGEHVWLTPDGLTLIDFDSCCLGDPAVDIGKFLADLRFWCMLYAQGGLEQAQEQFLTGYGVGAPERLARARLYEAIELIKETVPRVHLFERDWACRTERLIGFAQAVLNDLQRSLGLPVK